MHCYLLLPIMLAKFKSLLHGFSMHGERPLTYLVNNRTESQNGGKILVCILFIGDSVFTCIIVDSIVNSLRSICQ